MFDPYDIPTAQHQSHAQSDKENTLSSNFSAKNLKPKEVRHQIYRGKKFSNIPWGFTIQKK